jgi:hypothetical protein
MSRRTKFLTSGAIVFAVGLGGGGLAYAASSGSAPALTHVDRGCSGLSLTVVHGVKAPKVTKIETPVSTHAKPIVCGPRGETSGR